jgi:hypothetical protein
MNSDDEESPDTVLSYVQDSSRACPHLILKLNRVEELTHRPYLWVAKD